MKLRSVVPDRMVNYNLSSNITLNSFNHKCPEGLVQNTKTIGYIQCAYYMSIGLVA